MSWNPRVAAAIGFSLTIGSRMCLKNKRILLLEKANLKEDNDCV